MEKQEKEKKNKDTSKEEVVQISKATLNEILKTMEDLKASNENLVNKDAGRQKEIDMLKSVADRGRLDRYEAENSEGGEVIRTARVGFWEDMPILGWKTVVDEVGFRDGALRFKQIVKLFLDEGKEAPKEVEVEQLYWAQNTICKVGEVVEKNSDKNGQYWTIEMKDGRRVKLDIRFVNPF